MKVFFSVMLVLLALAGCEDRFRYPCQNPDNWETKQCQRPKCATTGTCPDQLVNPEHMKEKS